jgi:hypothetical protein
VSETLLSLGEYRVVTATLAHVAPIASAMRQEDAAECLAGCGLDPYAVLLRSLAISANAWTVLKGEEPVAMLGVARKSALSLVGVPWLLGAEGFSGARRFIVHYSKEIVATMLRYYPRLENMVDARYVKSVRWIRWMGFTVEPAEPYGPSGMPFHRFWMERAQAS